MRIATFNLESLDLPPKARVPLEVRAEMLCPALERLQADVLCLQEVNGQHTAGQSVRRLSLSIGCWPGRGTPTMRG